MELQKDSMRMQKQGKANSAGTLITFVPVECAKEYKEEFEKIISSGKDIGLEMENVIDK